MDDWTPLLIFLAVVIAVISVVGGFVGRAAMKTSAVKAQAQADAEHSLRYQELAEQCAAVQQQLAAELGRLNERVGAIEKLLRDVG
jgi:prepilin signal peptidase PulO-like enzyme (type II secretory pathway)